MVFISSSTSNEWPQNQIVDDQKSLMASTARLMDKSEQQQQQQQQQEALRCPRCDSSNTKFCYYNNYSLSQPRHFCKACKRYWTRGGTLRNVPVGGGCRKNKRVKRLTAGVDGTSSVTSSASSANTNPPSQPQIDLSSTSNHVSPLFYGLHTNPSDMNLSFSRFSSGISNVESVTGFDVIQPQLNALGLGFSSGILTNGVDGSDYRPGYNSSKQIHDIVSSNSLLSSYSMFGTPSSSSTATVTAPPSITSLLASKFINGGSKETRVPNHFHFMETFDPDVGVIGNEETEVDLKGVKEEAQNKLEWNIGNYQNQSDQTRIYDPSVYWNSLGVSWHDPANIGSSVTSLI